MTQLSTPRLTAGQLRNLLAATPDDMPIMIQRLDDESVKAGFDVRSLITETLDYSDIEDHVAEDVGRGVENVRAEYVSAASVSVDEPNHLLLININ